MALKVSTFGYIIALIFSFFILKITVSQYLPQIRDSPIFNSVIRIYAKSWSSEMSLSMFK